MGASEDQDRALHVMRAELNRLRERVENQVRYTDVVERKLRELMRLVGSASATVEFSDPIRPLNGGVSLTATQGNGRATAYGARDHAIAPRQAETDASWWPRAERLDRPLVPNAGWRNYALHGSVQKVIGISVCGLPRGVLEAAVASVANRQTALRDFVPVFLTDSTDFNIFRRHGFVFEYLPAAPKQAAYSGTKSWAEYAAERRALLERKWGLDHVVCFGPVEFGRPSRDVPAPSDTNPTKGPVAKIGCGRVVG